MRRRPAVDGPTVRSYNAGVPGVAGRRSAARWVREPAVGFPLKARGGLRGGCGHIRCTSPARDLRGPVARRPSSGLLILRSGFDSQPAHQA